MDNVFILYTCYTDGENDPCIFVSAYSSLDKAKERLKMTFENTKKQIDDIMENEYINDCDPFSIDFGDRYYEVREDDGERYWEAYIIEEEIQ